MSIGEEEEEEENRLYADWIDQTRGDLMEESLWYDLENLKSKR